MPIIDPPLELEPDAFDALLALLVSMASSDGALHAQELDLLVKLRPDLPDRDAVAEWAASAARPIDAAGLRDAIPDPDDRWKTMRFAARMAWKDGALTETENRFLERLATALELPLSAVDRVGREMKPDDGKRFTADRILRTLMEVQWDAVQLAAGALVSEDLRGVVAPDAEIVARVGLEKVEVMAICTTGIVGRFQEGAAFLPWSELVTYTRERGLGEALRLHTESGRAYTLVDERMTGLAPVLDRLLDLQEGGPREASPGPRIDTLRGE
jgi:DnaJ-domain-containing protein 1